MRNFRFAAIIAITAVTCFSTIAWAGCDDADQCSAAECRTRQSAVHPACDQSRSCKGITDTAMLRARLTINQQCLAARLNVNQCFSAPDEGHKQAITEVNNAIATCTAQLNGNGN